MKKLLPLTAVILILSSCGEKTGESAAPAASNVQSVKMDEFTLTELSDGYQRAVKYGEGGAILEEGVLKDGKRNGTWIVYNARKPIPQSVANFVNDQYSGPFIQYSAVGQVELLCHYKADKLHGKFTKYKNARVLEEGFYNEGQYDGAYKKYYAGKETLQQEANYKNGQLHGKSKYYNESGELIMEYEYKDGEKISGGIVENQ